MLSNPSVSPRTSEAVGSRRHHCIKDFRQKVECGVVTTFIRIEISQNLVAQPFAYLGEHPPARATTGKCRYDRFGIHCAVL
jgi:hypothetical protein